MSLNSKVVRLNGTNYIDSSLEEKIFDAVVGIKKDQNEFIELFKEMASVQSGAIIKQKYIEKPYEITTQSNLRKNFILTELYQKLNDRLFELLEEFQEDECERIFCLSSIRQALHNVKEVVRDEKELKYNFRTCILLHDMIKKNKVENIKEQHLPIIKKMIEAITNTTITNEMFKSFDKELLSNGLDWVIGG